MARCEGCQAPLETPLGCAACGRLFVPRGQLSPFEVLGLAPRARIDAGALRKALLRLGRVVHPDFFAGKDESTRALAERHSAALNEAFEVLSDDVRRADHLITSLGGPNDNDLREMPQPFLLEALDWNERLDLAQAGDAQARAGLLELEGELRARRAAGVEAVLDKLDPLPPPGAKALRQARAELNRLRYVERALERLAELAAPTAGRDRVGPSGGGMR
jgi:molecular chaperone HscB